MNTLSDSFSDHVEVLYVDRRSQLLHSDWCNCDIALEANWDCEIMTIAYRHAMSEWGTTAQATTLVLDATRVVTFQTAIDARAR